MKLRSSPLPRKSAARLNRCCGVRVVFAWCSRGVRVVCMRASSGPECRWTQTDADARRWTHSVICACRALSATRAPSLHLSLLNLLALPPSTNSPSTHSPSTHSHSLNPKSEPRAPSRTPSLLALSSSTHSHSQPQHFPRCATELRPMQRAARQAAQNLIAQTRC